jgi:oligosaccharide repeat unit polymerase
MSNPLNAPLPTFRGAEPSFFREVLQWFALLVLLIVILPVSLWTLPPVAFFSGLLILLSLFVMHRLVGLFEVKRLTIPAFFYAIYFTVILIPGFFLFSEEYTPSRGRFLFGIESVLVTVPLGIWLANRFLHFRKQETPNYFRRPVTHESLDASSVRVFVIFLAIALIFVAINLVETPVVPLIFLIRNPGETLAAALMREDAFKLLNSRLTYVYYVVRGSIFPFLTMVSFGRYLQQKQEIWWRLFWVSLISAVLYAALTIEKSPVAAIFGLLFVFYYLFRRGRLGVIATVTSVIMFLAFPVTVILLAYQGSDAGVLWSAIQAVMIRVFYGPAHVVYAYFQMFPAVIPFQHGAGIVKLSYVMGWKTIDIPNAVGMYMSDGTDLATISANGCFIGNLNADFGLPGVVVGGVLAGFMMQAVFVYLCRKPKTIVSLAACAACMWSFGELVISPLPTTLLSGGVTFALLLRWYFESRTRRRGSRNKLGILSPSFGTRPFPSGS